MSFAIFFDYADCKERFKNRFKQIKGTRRLEDDEPLKTTSLVNDLDGAGGGDNGHKIRTGDCASAIIHIGIAGDRQFG